MSKPDKKTHTFTQPVPAAPGQPSQKTTEAALFHAFSAEIARLPLEYQDQFDPAQMAMDYASGRQNEQVLQILSLAHVGNPAKNWDSEEELPFSDIDRAGHGRLQDALLSDYEGEAWLPDQVESLGRAPEPYELSPGGKISEQARRRQQLFDSVANSRGGEIDPWTGVDSGGRAAGAASLYLDGVRDTHMNWLDKNVLMETQNPENWLGTFATQMGPVGSDAGSQFGSHVLRGNISSALLDSVGDAATRSAGAQFNRTNPQFAQDHGDWRANNEVLNRGRQAYIDSEGMSSGDTFRSAFGFHIPYVQPLINTGMSIANGLLDFSSAGLAPKAIPSAVKSVATGAAASGIPGVSRFGRSVATDIGRTLTARPTAASRFVANSADELVDPMTPAIAASEYGEHLYGQPETDEQFDDRVARQHQDRQQGVKQLESLAPEVVAPKYGPSHWIKRSLGFSG